MKTMNTIMGSAINCVSFLINSVIWLYIYAYVKLELSSILYKVICERMSSDYVGELTHF